MSATSIFRRLFATKTRTYQHPKPARRPRLAFDTLEKRDCPAASLTAYMSGSTLVVEGTPYADSITVSQSGTSIGAAGRWFNAAAVSRIVVNSLGGNDWISNATGTVSTIDGGTGNDIIWGGSGADILSGGANNDQLFGQVGGDTMYGNDGQDSMYGWTGNDIMYGGEGNDHMDGQQDHDWLEGQAGVDTLIGWTGNDRLYGGIGNDNLYGGDGGDHLDGQENDDWLEGGEGVDHLHGWTGNDRLYGGIGNDNLYGGDGGDHLDGQEDNDWLEGEGVDHLHGRTGNDRLYGGIGNDNLYGGDGGDHLDGQEDNDWLEGGEGIDHLHGWTGDDRLYGGIGDDKLWGGDGGDHLDGQEDNDWLEGGEGVDHLHGWTGNDSLYGGDGDDNLYGGDGDDKLYGQEGNDQLYGHGDDDWMDAGSIWEYADGGDGRDFNAYVTAIYGTQPQDITQGGGNTCWILSSMGAVALTGYDLSQRIVYVGNDTYAVSLFNFIDANNPENGMYEVTEYVVFDGSRLNADPRFDSAIAPQEGESWVIIMQRAIIQAVSRWDPSQSIASPHSGGAQHAMAILTGVWGTSQLPIAWTDGQQFADYIAAGKSIVVHTKPESTSTLVPFHVYTVLGGNEYGVHLYNPHGAEVWISWAAFQEDVSSVVSV